MKLYNSRTKKIEEFKSLAEAQVKMYSCGPTVYDFAHIGNIRAYVFVDVLKKTLQADGYSVKHIMNITDFGHLVGDGDDGEDKMSEGLRREGLPRTLLGMKTLADKYTKFFIQDLEKMNISMPDEIPRASENISEYIKIIQGLEEKGFVYKTSDGLYFDTQKDKNYGAMSLLKNSENDESRIAVNSEKKNFRDFALWKFSDNSGIGFDSPFGYGFPGWHIECSGMAMKYLGETMDIHTGGIDHISVHHTNEIAQSENYTGKTFANFFCHNAFIDINNAKMSKSKNNYYTLNSIIDEGFSPLAYRYLILQAHYRQNINFTIESLKQSENALKKMRKVVLSLNVKNSDQVLPTSFLEKFMNALNDDLNTAEALATFWTMLKDESVGEEEKYWVAKKFDKIFSLSLFEPAQETEVYSEEIQKLIEERNHFRDLKNFTEADKIRDKLKSMGIEIKDK